VKTEASSSPAVILAVVGGGAALSFASGVLPHYDGAYRLQPLIFFSGLVLYVVYGVLAHFLRGRVRSVSGIIVFALHLAVAMHQRWLTDGYLTNTLLYWFPLVLAVGLLGLIPIILRDELGPRQGECN
jgi:hypothetical protein